MKDKQNPLKVRDLFPGLEAGNGMCAKEIGCVYSALTVSFKSEMVQTKTKTHKDTGRNEEKNLQHWDQVRQTLTFMNCLKDKKPLLKTESVRLIYIYIVYFIYILVWWRNLLALG